MHFWTTVSVTKRFSIATDRPERLLERLLLPQVMFQDACLFASDGNTRSHFRIDPPNDTYLGQCPLSVVLKLLCQEFINTNQTRFPDVDTVPDRHKLRPVRIWMNERTEDTVETRDIDGPKTDDFEYESSNSMSLF